MILILIIALLLLTIAYFLKIIKTPLKLFYIFSLSRGEPIFFTFNWKVFISIVFKFLINYFYFTTFFPRILNLIFEPSYMNILKMNETLFYNFFVLFVFFFLNFLYFGRDIENQILSKDPVFNYQKCTLE